jgi:hypothetical protein
MTSLCRRPREQRPVQALNQPTRRRKVPEGGVETEKSSKGKPKAENIISSRLFTASLRGICCRTLPGPQKIKGAVLQGRPHAHAAAQLTMGPSLSLDQKAVARDDVCRS